MNLTEIKDAVLDITKRTDKADQIHRIVREAITTVHSLKLFPRDMIEDIVQLSDNTYQQFKVQLPPRFREFECIRPCTAAGAPLATVHEDNNYERVRPKGILDNSHNAKTDIYYITGAGVAIQASTAPKALYMAWYALPEVADNNLETWLMTAHSQTFIDTAVSMFHARNGREAIAREIRSDLRADYLQIISDYAEGD